MEVTSASYSREVYKCVFLRKIVNEVVDNIIEENTKLKEQD